MTMNLSPAGRWLLTMAFVLGGTLALAQSPPAPADKADAFAEAARKGDAAAVKKLLDEGVDVNTKFRYNRTALSFACDRGNLDVVKLLLDRGADVNARDNFYNASPLTWAVGPATGSPKAEHREIVRLLLAKGAQGKGPALTNAITAGDAAMAKIILDSGFPPEALTDALETAKRVNKADLVAMLEAAGAKPRVEFKIDEATLAKYAGTYHGPMETDIVLTVAGGRLTGAAQGQRLTFVARDQTTFGVTEAPGATLTIKLDGDKVTAIGFPAPQVMWTRVEGK